jgi:vesicle coat complex subunit
MKQRIKSTPDDERLVSDESADVVDRTFAIRSLVYDGFDEIEPVLSNLLTHSEAMLRGEAIVALLSRFDKAQYFEKAIQMLHFDADFEARQNAALAVSLFVQFSSKASDYKEIVIKELLKAVIGDKNEFVQKRSYEHLHQLIAGKNLFVESHLFDQSNDIDWNLLQPYLEKYNLQKPAGRV